MNKELRKIEEKIEIHNLDDIGNSCDDEVERNVYNKNNRNNRNIQKK